MLTGPAVQLNGRDFASRGEQYFGQYAGARSNFEDVVFDIDFGPCNGALKHLIVDQKVLTKSLLERLLGAEGINQTASVVHASTGRRSSVRRGTSDLSSISSTKR